MEKEKQNEQTKNPKQTKLKKIYNTMNKQHPPPRPPEKTKPITDLVCAEIRKSDRCSCWF